MRILALCGSLRADSTTYMALEVTIRGIEQAGGTCDLLTGDDMDLPLYREEDGGVLPAKIQRLRELARKADGFLWGSPEYHGGYSGVLKNALDWLSEDELGSKPVALLAVAGGTLGAVSTLNGLRICARNVGAWVLPEQVSLGSSWNAFDVDGEPKDTRVEERLVELGRKLVETARVLPKLRDAGAL